MAVLKPPRLIAPYLISLILQYIPLYKDGMTCHSTPIFCLKFCASLASLLCQCSGHPNVERQRPNFTKMALSAFQPWQLQKHWNQTPFYKASFRFKRHLLLLRDTQSSPVTLSSELPSIGGIYRRQPGNKTLLPYSERLIYSNWCVQYLNSP